MKDAKNKQAYVFIFRADAGETRRLLVTKAGLQLRFDCDSTALRLLYDLLYERIRLPVRGLLHCGLNKQRGHRECG